MQGAGAQNGFVSSDFESQPRRILFHSVPAASALALFLAAGAWLSHSAPAAIPATDALLANGRLRITPDFAQAPNLASAPAAANPFGSVLVDLRGGAHPDADSLALNEPPELAPEPAPSLPAPAAFEPPAAQAAAAPEAPEEPSRFGENIPLPPRKPAGLAALSAPPVRPLARQSGATTVAAAPSDNRSFLERFFGGAQQAEAPPPPAAPPRVALAYANPDAGGLLSGVRGVLNGVGSAPAPAQGAASAPPGGVDRQTAIYDISARTVYMPDGTRLEAHSGLGPKLDDPRYVHERMHGPTPPHLYALSPREALFHGVEALRLTPIGGGGIFGRAGLLAHTFMLGPNGDSNGCVSFRDYQAFLRAYKSGAVRRLLVVARMN